jgi:hypothetical protein
MLTALCLAAQLVVAMPSDTPPPSPSPRPRPRAVEVSDWYNRRLTIHRWLSYSLVPLFGYQYLAGKQIWDKGANAPAWARTGHRVGATTLAGVFTVNTITGAWNLWDSRAVEEGRGRRYFHAVSMLAADAGFTWAGATLSEQAERDPEKRKLHRTIALTSMGITVTSGLFMKFLNK